MSVELNHTIIWCSDKQRSADFLTEILGRPAARPFHHFLVVDLDNRVSVDFYQKKGPVSRQHYAFLVGEAEFDAAFERIRARELTWWADPARTKPKEINQAQGDQSPRRRPRPLFRGSRRPPARVDHPALRQRGKIGTVPIFWGLYPAGDSPPYRRLLRATAENRGQSLFSA